MSAKSAMRSTRGGGRGRRGGRHNQNTHFEGTWSRNPVNQFHRDTPSSSSPSSSQEQQHPENNAPNSRRYQRNSKWVSRNSLFVKKSELNRSESGDCSSSGDVGLDNSEVAALGNSVENLSVTERVIEEQKNEGKEGEVKEAMEKSTKDGDDILGRLVELRSGAEEPELSKEQLEINDQLQEDELLAMGSIYGENAVILDREGGLRTFQIHIHIEATETYTITTKLNSSGGHRIKSNGPEDFSYSFPVQHLPPIVLTCLFPQSYPSHLPPYFIISVQWLDSSSISNLCSKLDSLWIEQPGQEIIYQWVDWLQNFSLSYLGYDQEIILGPYGMEVTKDKRAISGISSPDVDVPSLRSYNDEKCHENFCKSLQECCICFSEYPGTEFIRLPCKHFFCAKCMKTYSDMHVKEGTVSKLQCPDAKCDGMVPPALLKRLLGDEEFERWESLMLQKTLESMSDIVYCPRCETPCIEDEDQHAQCSKCYFSFCTLCMERRHVGIACMTPELKLCILQERQNSSVLKEDQRRKELEMINEILSVKEVLRDAKQCPSCKMAISRTEGCNKMVCNNCGQYFCYRCNKAIDGYEHFRDGECELFPQEMVRDWEERINHRQVLGQIQAELFVGHGQSCPNCRQFNAKMGNNNHLFCWACQTHYCYLCRKIVRRSSEHYGPRGCKQHTAD